MSHPLTTKFKVPFNIFLPISFPCNIDGWRIILVTFRLIMDVPQIFYL